MTELTLRAPVPADAAEIADVLNVHAASTGRPADETAEGVARWFALEDLDPANDMFLAVEDGRIVGYADVSAPGDDAGVVYVDLRALPGRPRVIERLLGEVERRARELGEARRSPSGAGQRGVTRSTGRCSRGAASASSGARSRWRSTSRSPARSPSGRPGSRHGRFEPGEERAVYDAYVEAFADHWGFVPESFADWRTWNLGASDDTSLWRLVEDDGEIAALCVSRPSRGEDEALGWVSILAVRRPWRRRGLARALLLESFGLFRSIGRRRVGLGVDAENTTGALALYEGVGMRVTSRSDTWERML